MRRSAKLSRTSPPDRRSVLGFAHRGGMADAPENSLEAFSLALAKGAQGLESDVWFAPDGSLVLHHGPVRRLRARPLELATLFEVCGTSYDLSLDLKDVRTAAAVVEVARAAGFDLRRLWLCGRGSAPLAWRPLDPQVRLVTDTRIQHTLPAPWAYLRRLHAGGIDAVNLRRGRWSAGLVERVHDAGLLAFAWDVQSSRRLERVLGFGVDAVYSDSVDLLVRD